MAPHEKEAGAAKRRLLGGYCNEEMIRGIPSKEQNGTCQVGCCSGFQSLRETDGDAGNRALALQLPALQIVSGGRCYSHFCRCVEKAAAGPTKPLGPQSARPDLLDRSRPPVSKTGVFGEDFDSLQTSFFRSVADSLRKYRNLRKSASLPTFFATRVYKSIKIESFREKF